MIYVTDERAIMLAAFWQGLVSSCAVVYRDGTSSTAENRVFTQRFVVFHAETPGPFTGEVALEAVIDCRCNRHCNQSAEARQRHIFLRIPDVPLRSEIRST